MEADLLGGLRVLEAGSSFASAWAGKLLAGLGADVIHVQGAWDDEVRAQGPCPPGRPDIGGWFEYLHMGKRLLPSRELTRDFVDSAELVLVGGQPGEMDGQGLSPEELQCHGSRLSTVFITPFGRSGPYSDYRASDLLEFLAFGRFSDAGLAGRPPIGYSLHAAELYAGPLAAAAGLAAVRHGRRTGIGLHADLSVAECILASPDRAFTLFSCTGQPLPRPEAHREVFVFSRDGHRIMINTGLDWARTAAMLELPELRDDPRFDTLVARMQHADEVYALVAAWAAGHDRSEIVDALARHRVMGSPLLAPHEVFDDEQYNARGSFDELRLAGAPPARVPGVPFKADGERPRLAAAAGQRAQPGWRRGMPPTAAEPAGAQPLAGVRVLDLGELYAGPNACSLLGDLGADVIKVENVQRMPAVVRGDRNPPEGAFGYFRGEPGVPSWELFHLFHTVERNKRGVTLDIKHERGREVFLRLVRASDAVVSNYTPRALRDLRVSAEDLLAANPQLTFVHLPGFGADGPYADRVSVGPVAEALSGHWAVRGYVDEPELQSNQTVFSDAVAGATACLLAIAGVLAKEAGNGGHAFDLSQAEAVTCFVAGECMDFDWNGAEARRYGDKHPRMAPHGSYPVAGEDQWVAIAVRDDAEWGALARAIGRDDLASDPGLATLAARKAREAELDAAIVAWTHGREPQAVVAALQSAGVACVPLVHDDQLAKDPQVVAREMLESVHHAAAGSYLNPASPFRFVGLPRVPRRAPNLLGEHNSEVLGVLAGCSPDELASLEQLGVVGRRFR